MNASRLRGFLLQLPKPTMVRVTGDGEPQELRPGKSFAKLAETIIALGPELIELLDKEGKVIRATRLDSDESRRSDAAPIPDALKGDPETIRITHFANLIHRAYEHSSEVAFNRLVDLVERMNDRSDSIEQRLERAEARNRQLLQDQVDDAFERAQEQAAAASAEGGDFGQQLVAGFVNGAAQRAGAQPKPNGKGQA